MFLLVSQVLSIFSYYYGLRAIPDAMVMDSLIGVPTYLLHEFVSVSTCSGLIQMH